MPIGKQIGIGQVFEDGAASFMARVRGGDGVNILQADLSAITCAIFDSDGAAGATPTVVVSTSIFDTLQESGATTGKWNPEIDTTGFNFNHDMPATSFPLPGRYTVEYKFTPTVAGATGVFFLVFHVTAHSVLTS